MCTFVNGYNLVPLPPANIILHFVSSLLGFYPQSLYMCNFNNFIILYLIKLWRNKRTVRIIPYFSQYTYNSYYLFIPLLHPDELMSECQFSSLVSTPPLLWVSFRLSPPLWPLTTSIHRTHESASMVILYPVHISETWVKYCVFDTAVHSE